MKCKKMKEIETYEGKEKYIFISYCHEDGDMVFPIVKRLQEEGYRIWLDTGTRGGEIWDDVVADHLCKCELAMIFMSKNWADSMECAGEFGFAKKYERRIGPIKLEPFRYQEKKQGKEMRLSPIQELRYYEYEDKELFYKKLFKTKGIEACRGNGKSADYSENHSAEEVQDIKKETRHAELLERISALKGAEPVSWHLKAVLAMGKGREKDEADDFLGLFEPYWILRGGTGADKQAIAELAGEIYRECGLLSQGHLVIRTGSELVAYMGADSAESDGFLNELTGGVLLLLIEDTSSPSEIKMEEECLAGALRKLFEAAREQDDPFAVIAAADTDGAEKVIRSAAGTGVNFKEWYISGDKEENRAEICAAAAHTPPALEKIRGLVGLDQIRRYAENLAETMSEFRQQEQKGIPNGLTVHCVLKGASGTGKTQLAKILERLYNEIGVLEKDSLVSLSFSELAGPIQKIREYITQAAGGVLLIDNVAEASGHSIMSVMHSGGKAAVNEILSAGRSGKIAVITAGYPKEIDEFLGVNSEFAELFRNHIFQLEDYTAEQLTEILQAIAGRRGFSVEDDLKEALSQLFENGIKEKLCGANGWIAEYIENQLYNMWSTADADDEKENGEGQAYAFCHLPENVKVLYGTEV